MSRYIKALDPADEEVIRPHSLRQLGQTIEAEQIRALPMQRCLSLTDSLAGDDPKRAMCDACEHLREIIRREPAWGESGNRWQRTRCGKVQHRDVMRLVG